jgi:cyanophycin synthetase
MFQSDFTLKNLSRVLQKNKRLRKLFYKPFFRFYLRPYLAWRKIPIIAITGTNGKTTITRLLNRIYLMAGYRVAMCCSDGIYRNDVLLYGGDQSGGYPIWVATRRQKIDIVVAETGRGDILAYGLGFHTCRVGVVTNVYEDHLGLEGVDTVEQMAEAKSAIPRHTHPDGTVVLNGDQPLVKAMAMKTQSSVIYFTVEHKQDEFDHCYYLKDGWIFKKSGSNSEPIIDVKTIPITLQGELIYNVANIMAVLAAVEGMQTKVPVSLETVHTVLQEFGKDPKDNPTRLTFLRFKERFVLLCKCKNPESFRKDVQVIQNIQKKYGFDNVVGILTAVGNRREDHFKKISRNVADSCKYFFIRPPADKYLRTRTGEDIIRFLSASIPNDRILSTENLPLESVFDQTQQTVNGKCLYVYFDALLEANLDVPNLISEGQVIPIEIGG